MRMEAKDGASGLSCWGSSARFRHVGRRQCLLDERLRPLNRGDHRPQSTMTVTEFAEGEWMSLVVPTHKLSTQRGYRVTLRNHVLPHLGRWRLCDLTRQDVQRFVGDKFRQKLAWQTVHNIWTVASAILESAVEYGYLKENPARGVRFPPRPMRRGPAVLQAEAFSALLSHLTEPVSTMVMLVAVTGLRVGELLALRWQAIDVQAGTLRVQESVTRGQFQTPKTEQGIRTIPLGPFACDLVQRHRQRTLDTEPTSLLFVTAKGKPHSASNLLAKIIQPAAQRAGLGHITWHQLRHVHSSLLHNMGVPVKIAQQQLGHASVATTLNIYTHVVADTHRKAIVDLERELFPYGSQNEPPSDQDGSVTH